MTLVKLKPSWKRVQMVQALDAYLVMREVLMKLDPVDRNREFLWVLGLSTDNKIRYIDTTAIGKLNALLTGPNEIFAHAVRFGGIAGIILIHSHPSGNTVPSEADKKFTNTIIEAGKILQIQVLDHIIITGRSYYSFLGENNSKRKP